MTYTNFVSKVVHVIQISRNPLGIDFSLREHKLNPTVLDCKNHNYFGFYHGNCKIIVTIPMYYRNCNIIVTIPMVNYHGNCKSHNYLTITMVLNCDSYNYYGNCNIIVILTNPMESQLSWANSYISLFWSHPFQ